MRNFDLFGILVKWKKALAIIVVAAAVISGAGSYLIKPKYKSFAIVYPTNLSPYSQESSTEQMLQLMQSDSIFNSVVYKFGLIKHYKLDPKSPHLRSELQGIYNDNVSIRKTEYEAVKIEVLDQDPQMACDIVNEILSAFNAYTLQINKLRTKEYNIIWREQLDKQQRLIDSTTTALKSLAVNYGLVDYSGQSRELSKEYYRSIASSNPRKIEELTNSMRNLEERGGKFKELQDLLNNSTYEYARILIQYNTTKNDLDKNLTYTNVVTKPYPADKKATPIRWLIVMVATCASVLFTLIVIMIVEERQFSKNSKS